MPSKLLRLAALMAMVTGVHGENDHSVVEPFPLGSVRLLDSPFKQAMERNVEYLLALEPKRFLHYTRKNAGIEPQAEI